MNIIGRTTGGDLIVQIPLGETDRLAKAVAVIEEILMPQGEHREAAPTPAPQHDRTTADPERPNSRPSRTNRKEARPATRADSGVKSTKPCATCGKLFHARTCGRYCSKACKRAKHGTGSGPKAATECARCHAPRATTPWPKAGRFCKACTAAIARAKYNAATAAAKASAKPGAAVRKTITRDIAGEKAKKAAAPHGVDRIRAAMARIEAGEGLPQDGGRTVPILPD